MPPVTERTSRMSRVEVRPAFFPQKPRHSAGASSPSEKSSEMRPTNPFEFWMFLPIQAETLPATMKMSLSCFENCVSHAVLRKEANEVSYLPIHEISSRNTTVLPLRCKAASSASNALGQQSAFASGIRVAPARRSQKLSICRWLSISLSGASPTSSMNVHFERAANSSTKVDLPMRRRPAMTTKELVFLRQRALSFSSCSPRPKKFCMVDILSCACGLYHKALQSGATKFGFSI